MTTEDHAPLITLLTDFGTADTYVAAMKGVILGITPDARLVDITHEVPSQDILSASFLLMTAYPCFPARSIHLCVVDPGVGTARRAIVVTADQHLFVAPDNGLLTWILEREKDARAYQITADHYFRKPVSSTFHGRDVFAPVAAWLGRGIEPPNFGPRIDDPVRLPLPKVQRVNPREFLGTILHIDRFGNLITSFPVPDMEKVASMDNLTFRLVLGDRDITEYRHHYGGASPDRLFAIPGSAGFVELSLREGSAARLTGAKRGDPIRLLLG